MQMLQLQLAEMGSEEGHCAQDALVTRLAAAILAPWQQVTPQAPARGAAPMEVDGEASTPGRANDPQYAAAACRADIMLDFAWGWIFDKAVTSDGDVDIKCASQAQAQSLAWPHNRMRLLVEKLRMRQRQHLCSSRRAMLHYVLVPCLRLAPAQYCRAKVAMKMPALVAVIKQTAARPQVLHLRLPCCVSVDVPSSCDQTSVTTMRHCASCLKSSRLGVQLGQMIP